MRVIVVGAGGTTRELLRRLGEVWDVVVVTEDQTMLDSADAIRPIETILGDGSSAVVLGRAGLNDADALVAATADDDRNLEALRIAAEAGVTRLVGVAANPERMKDYRELGVPAYAPDSLTSRHVEVMLEPRRVASTGFAEGKAEAVEVLIRPDAPVRGRTLSELHSETWVVAAVLRAGELIIPHGSTTIETGDRVTVVGSATDYQGILKAFTSGESSFPLGYGRKAVVAVAQESDIPTLLAEAIFFVRNSQAEALTVVHRDPEAEKDPARAEEIQTLVAVIEERAADIELELRPTVRPLPDELIRVARDESAGTLVVAAPTGGRFARRRRFVRMFNRYGSTGVPLLISRSRFPYDAILAPARLTDAGEVAGRSAIDIARSTGGTLTGVSVVGPTFATNVDTLDDARASAGWLREEGAVHRVNVKRKIRRGNPVRVIEELAENADLVVMTMPSLPVRSIRPGVTCYVAETVASSVLVVPPIS
jgi:trk system potassium uptake protein TrkA